MTPPARLQAAIEIIDLILAAVRENGAAADTIIARWFKTRRFAGSKDRAAVRDHVYAAIRAFGDPPASGRAAFAALPAVHELFDGSPHGPAPLASDEAGDLPATFPAWLSPMIAAEEQILLARAPFDLRVNALKTTPDAVLALLPDALRIPGTANGIRLSENIVLANQPALAGLVEVQDAGSQLVAEACAARPGQTIVDLCAGAGGKTLALAADMNGRGRLIACDTDRGRLSRLPARANLAGATGIETRLLNPNREMEVLADLDAVADCVLIDAPCSGTGTWRRNPELRWRLSPARLEKLVTLQAHVLDLGARLVKPGGTLVYAVCSLLEREGTAQISAFLARHSDWSPVTLSPGLGRPSGDGLSLSTASDGTDGFFVARLAKG